MKKNMIALAVAGALVAPVAMAEVTISGGLQAELVQIGGDAGTANGLYAADGWQAEGKTPENAGNYGFLKFSASEDLGGGMKALAVYNFNVNVGDNSKDTSPAGAGATGTVPGAAPGSNSTALQREAYVGLSGGFGTVLAGSMVAPYAQNRTIDPFLATSFQARGNGGMRGDLHNGYLANTIAYANSFMGGMIKFTGGIALDESAKAAAPTDDKTVAKHATTFAVDVAPVSGLTVTVAYANMNKFGDTAGTGAGDKLTATKVAAKYATSAFSVAAQMEMLDKGFDAGGEGDKHNVTFLTGTFNMDDANSISASYGRTDKKGFADGAKNETYMAVGFKHAFSKNTSALVGYRKTADLGGASGVDETAVGAGLRVAF